jgi:hypothetical protein
MKLDRAEEGAGVLAELLATRFTPQVERKARQ